MINREEEEKKFKTILQPQNGTNRGRQGIGHIRLKPPAINKKSLKIRNKYHSRASP